MFTILIILIVLCNFNTKSTVVNPSSDEVASADNVEFVSLNITYEEKLGGGVVNKARRAIEKFSPEVVKAFAEQGWKIAVVSEISLDGTQYEGITTPLTVGLTDYDSKTIQVSPYGDVTNDFITIRMVHEFAHFAESFYGNVADTSDWKGLYKKYRDSYVEYEYNGIVVNEENKNDIAYATSDRYEFFACTMKDFYCHPEYLHNNYPDVYDFLFNLVSP